jgi:two-component sensor histidine kinase
LTVSPLKNQRGEIVGASKIARDITERRRALEQQQLLLREMNHRVKNLFALASSVVSLSARSTTTPAELASKVGERLGALARAHALTLPKVSGAIGDPDQPASLHALIRTVLSPHEEDPAPDEEDREGVGRISIRGVDPRFSSTSVTSFALLLHEFATNAAKYGALSMPTGDIEIECSETEDTLVVVWTERGGPPIEAPPHAGPVGEGFGSVLARMTVQRQLGGRIERDWKPEGLVIRLSVPKDRLNA